MEVDDDDEHFQEITLSRIKLRPFDPLDLCSFVTYRNNPEVSRYQTWTDYNLEMAQKLYDTSCHIFNKPDSWYQIAIVDITTNNIIGDCGLHFIDDIQVEIGFTLSLDYQGKGIATETLKGLLNYLFFTLGKHRIIATVDVLNSSCIKLLERLHFRREGHFIENIMFKGSWGSEYMYAILRREWK
jgi:RimJ/RimL family protein N-acetyltransferase